MKRDTFKEIAPKIYQDEFEKYINPKARNKHKVLELAAMLAYNTWNYDKGYKNKFYYMEDVLIKDGKNPYRNGTVWVYLNPNKYPFKGFSYTQMKYALEILEKVGIFVIEKGEMKFKPITPERPYWEPFESKMTKVSMVPVYMWKVENMLELYHTMLTPFFEEKIEEKIKTTFKIKLKKKKELIIEAEEDKKIERINRYLIKRGFSCFQYGRRYGENEFEMGRLYNAITNISKRNRIALIEKDNLVEVDLASSFINAFYIAETGEIYQDEKYNNDPYTKLIEVLPSDFKLTRPEAKKFMMRFICNNSASNAKKSMRQIMREKKMFTYNGKGIPVTFFHKEKDILKTIENAFPEIKKYFYNNNYNWAFYVESETLIIVLNKMIKLNILPLSIHDAVLVPKHLKEYFENFFLETFIKVIKKNTHILTGEKIQDKDKERENSISHILPFFKDGDIFSIYNFYINTLYLYKKGFFDYFIYFIIYFLQNIRIKQGKGNDPPLVPI